MKLEGKVAVITGGSKGIGFGCARVFAKHGASVVIGARGEQAGRDAEQSLADAGYNALFVATDVTRPDEIRRLIDAAVERFGRLDSIVNNAGWHPPDMTIDDTSLDEFEDLLRLNLTSTFLGSKFAVPHLRKTRGTIINISSVVAKVGQPASVAYVTTKAGQVGLTRALAVDLAPEGIRVNAVCPGAVRTPLLEDWARTQGEDLEKSFAEYNRAQPRGYMGTIDEIGEICAFLASDESSFITGQAIYSDGGVMLG